MKRRDFLAASAAISLLGATPAFAAKKSAKKSASSKAHKSKTPTSSPSSSASSSAPASGSSPVEPRSVISLPDEPPAQWRTYNISTSIKLQKVNGKSRVWLPLAQYKDSPWQRSLGHSWQGNFENAGIYRDPVAEMEVFYADWKDSADTPHLHLVSQVATQDRHFDITRRGAAIERNEVLRRSLQSSSQMPTDGIVRHTAERAVGRIKDPVAQGKALYDWVVENTSYDPQLKGCGTGDITTMLDSGRMSGKSADIALLFVALCRSMGIPARPVFGMRIDYSRLFGGLGATGSLNLAQHCRAEFYGPGYGWIPVDPADVRKAILDERLTGADSKLVVLKKLLFGFWEMNWIGFNAAQDVDLRGAAGRALPFLAFPQAEVAGRRLDPLEGESLSYSISASRLDS